jgi:hypothetical protein
MGSTRQDIIEGRNTGRMWVGGKEVWLRVYLGYLKY